MIFGKLRAKALHAASAAPAALGEDYDPMLANALSLTALVTVDGMQGMLVDALDRAAWKAAFQWAQMTRDPDKWDASVANIALGQAIAIISVMEMVRNDNDEPSIEGWIILPVGKKGVFAPAPIERVDAHAEVL